MSEAVIERRRRLMVRLVAMGLVWSIGLLLAALLLPTYDGQTVTDSNGVTLTSATFVQVNGAGSLLAVAVPALACLLVAAALRRRIMWLAWSTVGVLAAFCLVAILSIGVFLLPVVALLGFAVSLAPAEASEPVGSGTHPVHG